MIKLVIVNNIYVVSEYIFLRVLYVSKLSGPKTAFNLISLFHEILLVGV